MIKTYKISKYLILTFFVMLISSLVGQKHSSDYGFSIPTASADIPAPADSSGGSDSSSDDGGSDGSDSDSGGAGGSGGDSV